MKRKVISGILAILLFASVPVRADYSSIDTILSAAHLKKEDVGMMISEESYPVFGLNESKKFTPASLTKILTAGAALDLLGSQYEFHTQLLADGHVADRILHGSLYLKCAGDPLFNSLKLQNLVQTLATHNIKLIEGDIIVDDSRFGDVPSNNTSSIPGMVRSWQGNPSAAVFVHVHPEIQLLQATLKAEQKQRKVLENDKEDLIIYENMIQPDLLTGLTLKSLFQKSGIRLQGTVKRGRIPIGAWILADFKNPLVNVVSEMLKASNNFAAEMLAMNLAAERRHGPVTVEAGLERIEQFLDNIGIPRSEYCLASAAGFSRRNYISPAALCRVLQYLRSQYIYYPTFLPIAGVDGTLKHRMRKTPGQGKIVAKTGYLAQTNYTVGVVGLAGFVPRNDGRTLTFAFIYNGPAHASAVRNAFDKICVQLIQ